MRVRLLKTKAGPGGSFHRGQILDLPKNKALALLKKGDAEAIKQPVERAVVAPKEKAVTR